MPIEVKSARSVTYSDTAHLRTFSGEYGDLVRGSLLLYDGEETFWIADEVLAVPWWRIV